MLCSAAGDSGAALFFDWADEFVGGTVDCNTDTSACTILNRMSGPNQDGVILQGQAPTWHLIGAQGANAVGRSNAREKIMFGYRDNDTANGLSMSVTLSRYRVASPPPEGSSCNVSGVFAGSATQTTSSLGFAPRDLYIYNRLKPVLDFSAETTPAGTAMWYRTVLNLIVTTQAGGNTTSKDGCYGIQWVN
jgi:hypothetical protein